MYASDKQPRWLRRRMRRRLARWGNLLVIRWIAGGGRERPAGAAPGTRQDPSADWTNVVAFPPRPPEARAGA